MFSAARFGAFYRQVFFLTYPIICDFDNENAELVKSIAELNMPKAAILGNHDSWFTRQFSQMIKDGVQVQLECLGEEHVGYKHLDFPTLKLSVVGGRPFSCGGSQFFRKKILTARYGVHNMGQSAERIVKAATGTPEEHFIILLAHNGPTVINSICLGSRMDDICGKDWEYGGGDHGDPGKIDWYMVDLLEDGTLFSDPLRFMR
ncbi:Tryptophan biosynthesis protein TrpCF [Bienertia sinuspersici]